MAGVSVGFLTSGRRWPMLEVVQPLSAITTARELGEADVPHHVWFDQVASVTRLTGGRVNDTFVVRGRLRRPVGAQGPPEGVAADETIVVQRLNEHVFPEPKAVVRNARRLVDHLVRRPDRRGPMVPTPVRTAEGSDAVVAADGGVWRARTHLAGRAATTETLAASAHAFGALVRDLSDLDVRDVEAVLPGLHDLSFALRRLERLAVAAEPAERRAVLGEVERARRCYEAVELASRELGVAHLPQRVVHNDTKLSNVIVLSDGGSGVIDLDLAGGGTVLADVGDLVRSAAVGMARFEPAELHRIVVDAWLSGIGERIEQAEREALVVAGPMVATELASRYLADSLDTAPTLRLSEGEAPRQRARLHLDLAERLLDTVVRPAGVPTGR